MEIKRNRNAGIIGGINGLQSGGREVGLSKDVKAKYKKNTLYRVFLGVKREKLSTTTSITLWRFQLPRSVWTLCSLSANFLPKSWYSLDRGKRDVKPVSSLKGID